MSKQKRLHQHQKLGLFKGEDSKETYIGQYFENISKIYANFKAEFPSLKIESSTFALQGPKWCKPVGVAGSQNVWICTSHQNVKLMLHIIDHSIKCKK